MDGASTQVPIAILAWTKSPLIFSNFVAFRGMAVSWQSNETSTPVPPACLHQHVQWVSCRPNDSFSWRPQDKAALQLQFELLVVEFVSRCLQHSNLTSIVICHAPELNQYVFSNYLSSAARGSRLWRLSSPLWHTWPVWTWGRKRWILDSV